MTPLVLSFRGTAEARDEALDRLRVLVPGIVLTPRTSTLVEALVEAPAIPLLQGLSEWQVSSPVYADCDPPAPNLSRIRRKLGL